MTARRIFVLCPPRIATGGPESLHLLVHELRRQGHDARMVYVPAAADATPREYADYRIAVAAAVEDAPENLVVVPEIWTWRLADFPASQKAIWWLSVDNHVATESPFDFSAPSSAAVRHLAGSEYAASFVRARGAADVAHLSSYVHERFAATPSEPRHDRVLYNPKKGVAIVERLRAALPELEWRAVENLSREEVAELMARSKVYVDFGHHPGRERLPREAALAGCCVVTGKKGSAGFDEDLAIPARYKLDDEPLAPIVGVIRDCVRDFAARQAEFADYRARVRGEKARFEDDVRRIFGGG